MRSLIIDDHPRLELGLITADLPSELGSPDWLVELLSLESDAPVERDEACRSAVRNLLRGFGYKPTGRGKPASEYLVRAAEEDKLTSINLPVDICNVVSLHSGLPISVVDADLVQGALRVRVAPEATSYIFNASGQEIRLDGLLCLHDQEGACANAVKDSQRTKTHEKSLRTLSLIWGTRELPGRCEAALDWYGQLLRRAGFTSVESECSR